jgi:trehalose 6-phosphate phosphatase
LLASDFDGTLAPIVIDPALARVLPANLALVDRLIDLGVHVAVISGRALPDLRERLPLDAARLFGENGLHAATDAERRAVQRFNAEAGRLVAPIAGAWIELKPNTTSVHFRRAADSGLELREKILPLADRYGLVTTLGRMVLEVTPQGADKARTMSLLVSTLQPKFVIYAGDDTSDQAVFRMLGSMQRNHIAIGISSGERPVDAFSECDIVYDGPHGMAVFLHRLLERMARRHPG